MACTRFRILPLALAGFLRAFSFLPAQNQADTPDPAAYIGLSLEDLLARYGIPRSVYAVRGLESWQDDVVFVYAMGDFYIYRDRVWQLGLKTVYDIKVGDSKALVSLVFGEDLQEAEDHVRRPLFGWNWPLTLRFNINGSGLVSAIYIYRSDL
ncbi:hypothetical protein AGMMS49928_02420 [Spirochaetia bacterium]|nr:hypothetical protein AGMMS49928_02420 [Spirochaetia bacterium]